MKHSDKGFYYKIYIAIGLCGAIAVCLLFLTFSGGMNTIREHAETAGEVPEKTTSAETAEPSAADSTEPAETADAETPLPSASPTPEPADTSSDNSLLRIVNMNHPLDPSYVPEDLVIPDVTQEGENTLRAEAASALEEMFAAASADGVHLTLVSGYRSYDFETQLYAYYAETYGVEHANEIDDHPGASEHQLGLAADLDDADDGSCRLNQCFGSMTASQWLSENAWKYGWILRYPQNGQSVTGIIYSPWNYRYVGKEAAADIQASGLTMEEYYGVN